jgi:carbon-monoxide dehydrogenase small subunit
MKEITLTINGQKVSTVVEPRMSLGDFLRVRQNLTGTHFGCEHGVCGACTVLINGAPARSCIAFAAALHGADIRTIEGFEDDPVMAAVRNAFHREHGLQCGFCTSGMLITARDIVTRFAEADEKRIRNELAGNLCRCTGYMGIVNAIQRVMRELPIEARLGKTPLLPRVALAIPATLEPVTSSIKANSTAIAPESGQREYLRTQSWSRLTESFEIDRPRSEVWQLFADLPRITACLPGARLTESDGRNLKGEMRVTFGPMRVGFAGTATISRDDESFTGVLEGAGSDAKNSSRAKGQVSYHLMESNGGTRVELAVEYQVQGTLAQFSRPGLVKDFASRLIAAFAHNLANELAGAYRDASTPPRDLHAMGIIWSVLWSRFKRWFGM